MTSIFNLYIIIPIINILLLAINFILAPHKPYKEKKTPFECGYHSFLWQNRTQFTISFFLFGLLFLMFDIEIVIIYPITVSSYFNAGFGIFVVILFVLILALGFVFELGKGALKIDSKQGRMRLHSSLETIPFLLSTEVPKQIISSIYDFFTKKLNAFNIVFKIVISGIFSSFVYLISFFLCSTWCLNLFSYAEVGCGLSVLLATFYCYSLHKKSDMFNWCYNLVNLILVLFFISLFWCLFIFVTKAMFGTVCFVFSSLVFSECVFDIDGDIGNPFTGQENISVFSSNTMFGEDILNMDSNPEDSSSTQGGSGDFGGPAGTGGPGGPSGPEAAAAAGASVSAQPSEPSEQSESSLPHKVYQLDPDLLGNLKDNEEIRANVHTKIEESDLGYHRFKYLADNCTFKEVKDFKPFFDGVESEQAMQNIDAVKEIDIGDAKTKCQEYKDTIENDLSIPREDKDLIKENLENNFEDTSSIYKNKVETAARDIANNIYPDYDGYHNTKGEFIGKDGVVREEYSDSSSDESGNDGESGNEN